MADLGKKYLCFSCGGKFYDMGRPEPICPKCGANQKAAPAKGKAVKKEKAVHVIEDDFVTEGETEAAEEVFPHADELAIDPGTPAHESFDPGDLRMDDYDE